VEDVGTTRSRRRTPKENLVSLYIDTNVVRAEIDRRFELAGVDAPSRDGHGWHRYELPSHPLGVHPFAAFVARLVGGSTAPTAGTPATRAADPVASGRPRHP
jgi:hypothetical protein